MALHLKGGIPLLTGREIHGDAACRGTLGVGGSDRKYSARGDDPCVLKGDAVRKQDGNAATWSATRSWDSRSSN